jgi:hypothetical protein
MYLSTKASPSELADDGVSFKPYLGAPILFYGDFDNYDLNANIVSFIDADGTTERPVTTCWYANSSNSYTERNYGILYLLWAGY